MIDGPVNPPSAASPWAASMPTQRRPPARRRKLPAAVVSAGVALSLLAPALLVPSGVGRPLDSIVAGGMILVAIMASASRPSNLPVIYFAYLVGNRLVRRLLDYSAQEFSGTPPTSLVVPTLGVLMCWVAASQWKSLPKSLRNGAKLFLMALAYGAVVGLGWGLGMVFELLSWIAPFGFGMYVAWLRPTPAEIKRWLAAFAAFAAIGMAYGWVQWLVLPPWDEFWVRHCGMGSIGAPQPMRCRFFGPFGAPGTAASVAVYGAVFLIITSCMSGTTRAVLIVFLGLSSLVTGVRSTWLSGIATVMSWIALRRGGGKKLVPLLLALAAGAFILPSLPGSDFATRRMNSLGDISSDGSFRGRVVFSLWAIGQVLGRPQGFGLGSSGLGASRLSEGTLNAFDSGYLQPLYALGLPGAALLIGSFLKLVTPLMRQRYWNQVAYPLLAETVRPVIIGFAVTMIVSNALRTDTACLFWMFVLIPHTTLRSLPAATVVPQSDPSTTPRSATG